MWVADSGVDVGRASNTPWPKPAIVASPIWKQIAASEAGRARSDRAAMPGLFARSPCIFISARANEKACNCFTERRVQVGFARRTIIQLLLPWPELNIQGYQSQHGRRISIHSIFDKAVAGERLTPDEGVAAAGIARSGGDRPRGRCRHASAASRANPHLQHRPQHQLHQHLHGGLRFLCVLSAAETCRRLCARARRAAAKNSRNGRTRRRSDSDAGRTASAVQAGVVRRTAGRYQTALSAGQHPRLQPAGNPSFHENLEAAAAHRAASG